MVLLATIPSGSISPTPLPAAARQVFDSFELITGAAPQAPPSRPPSAAPTVPLAVEITSSDTEGEVAPTTFEFEANVTGGTEPYTYSSDDLIDLDDIIDDLFDRLGLR
jgi:hypothetical protein